MAFKPILNLSETSLRECWVGSFYSNDTWIRTILCCFKVQEIFKICGQGGWSQNIAPKLVANITSKDSRTFFKSWSELLLNRLKPTKLLYQCILTFWCNFVCEGVLLCKQCMQLHTVLHRKLQEIALQHSKTVAYQVARMHASNCTVLSTFLLVNLNKR